MLTTDGVTSPVPSERPAGVGLELWVQHADWSAPLIRHRPASGGLPRYRLTNRYVEVDGVRAIPVSGELHYSRTPRHRWEQRLRQMKAGGITVVASYVFWNHHAVHSPEARFDDNLDLAAFVDLCDRVGLDVVLRIGPWCHGEARNGGFPDWLLARTAIRRTDDETYLADVRDWFSQLAAHLTGRMGADSNVVGIQVENELYDNPAHIVTLKRLAIECGFWAPVWTATAWGSAELPPREVLPLYGGYGDGFWVDSDAEWDDTFRSHYFFSHTWDDPGIGADVRTLYGPASRSPRPHRDDYPVATCELAGGMGTAYHRRPWPQHHDVATIAHNKLGSGSAWQGYYMLGGGTNPEPALQESHASGYPNDLQRLNYDYHAAIGQAGTLRTSYAELRLQHAFVATFGDRLTTMTSTLPRVLPDDVDDATTLRWGLRADRSGGFVFVSWHQPHVPLAPYLGATFAIGLPDEEIRFPPRPIDIPVGTLAHWPVGLTVAGVRVRWATASALTVLEDAEAPATLVLLAERGIDPQLALEADADVGADVGAAVENVIGAGEPFGELVLDAKTDRPIRVRAGSSVLHVLVLPAADRHRIAVLSMRGGRSLIRSPDEVHTDDDGHLVVRTSAPEPAVEIYDQARCGFVGVALTHVAGAAFDADATVSVLTEPQCLPPPGYGRSNKRASAPGPADIDTYARRYQVVLPPEYEPGQEATIEIDWAGDVGVVVVDGEVVMDSFWYGSVWELDASDFHVGRSFELRIVPLRPDAAVWVPEAAEQLRRATAGSLAEVRRVCVRGHSQWAEMPNH